MDAEFGLLAAAAALVGVAAAVTVCAVLAYGFFETELALLRGRWQPSSLPFPC